MSIFDELKEHGKGGYIFVSHSHDDIEKVRKVRNQLEEDGFEPLCFYLKCLEDDDEIADLIKREIDAREWFLFVDSVNARKSKWVRLEREYITETNRKKILTLNIDDEKEIGKTIEKVCHCLRVFICYSHKDASLARRINDKFKEKDYLTFFAQECLSESDDDIKGTANEIAEASRDGCVVALITENSVQSECLLNEILYALELKGNVIPVMVGDCEYDAPFEYYLGRRQSYRLSENPQEEEIERMIDCIGKNIISQPF